MYGVPPGGHIGNKHPFEVLWRRKKRPEGKGWCVSGEKTSALRGGDSIIHSEEAAGDGIQRTASVLLVCHPRKAFSAFLSGGTSVRLFHE